ncbi:MAG: DUF4197 domain-containing protein [Nitrospinae bacterium]|nr:DUF4197 domain-containing protein [Nitrospinota bacterium]
MSRMLATGLVVLFVLTQSATARTPFWKRLFLLKEAPISGEDRIAQGLKEALRVGIDKTIKYTGREDGYFQNDTIRIELPESFDRVADILRTFGQGARVDAFILSMNRSAEQAAPHAKKIFLDAISEMTIEDARKILKGSHSAATDYFREKTETALEEAFTPIVRKRMENNHVFRSYTTLTDRYRIYSFGERHALLDIEEYTVRKALDGLFRTLGEQERLIREDPAARVTKLLKEVFAD